MENTQNKDSIESVINRIKSGEAKMAPKWFFVIKTVLFVGLIFMVSIFLLYSASLVLFFVKKSGVVFLPVLGLRGIEVFLVSLPWILFVVIFSDGVSSALTISSGVPGWTISVDFIDT